MTNKAKSVIRRRSIFLFRKSGNKEQIIAYAKHCPLISCLFLILIEQIVAHAINKQVRMKYHSGLTILIFQLPDDFVNMSEFQIKENDREKKLVIRHVMVN